MFQQLIKLLHKDTRSFEVSACNLTIVEKSNKLGNNRHPPQKQFNVQLYQDTSLGTNVGVRKQHPPYWCVNLMYEETIKRTHSGLKSAKKYN